MPAAPSDPTPRPPGHDSIRSDSSSHDRSGAKRRGGLALGLATRSSGWLLVDAAAICGISLGAVVGWKATSSTGLVVGESIALLIVSGAAVGAVRLWRSPPTALHHQSAAGDPAGPQVGPNVASSPAPAAPARRSTGRPTVVPLNVDGERIVDLRGLHRRIARECYQHADGSGRVQTDAARTFFSRLDPTFLQPMLAAADLRTAFDFQRLVDRIASALGASTPEPLERLRRSIPEAVQDSMIDVAEQLAASTDPQAFRDLLAANCVEHPDGRGAVAVWAVPTLLSRLNDAGLARLFASARPKTLTSTARLIAALSRHFASPCVELERVRVAVIDAARPRLATTQQIDWIAPLIAGVACERSDGGGKVDREALRRLFEGSAFTRLAERIGHVPLRELNAVAATLARVSAGLDESQPPGFRLLVKAIDDAVELAASQMQSTILEAKDLASLRRTIVEGCFEYDDASGFQSRRALHAMFDGIACERLAPAVCSGSIGERQALRQLIRRLEWDRRGESPCSAVQQLLEMLAESVGDQQETRSAPAAVEPAGRRQRADEDLNAGEDLEHAIATSIDDESHDSLQSDAETATSGATDESLAEVPASADVQVTAAADEPSEDGLTWHDFKHADYQTCSSEQARQVARLLDQVAADGEPGLSRIVRRLWKGLRRDGRRLVSDWSVDDAPAEWERKRFLAEALERRADRRTVPKLIALLEASTDDPTFRDRVQPAVAKALIVMRDKRAIAALQEAVRSEHASAATRQVITAASRR